MALGDPFDFASTDPNAPGALGQSQGFWRDLASFGGNLAAAANARTSDGHLANGAGFGGPFGAAIGQTMEQGRQNAVTRSQLAYQGANTAKIGLENQYYPKIQNAALAQSDAVTAGQRLQNQYYPQVTEANIRHANAQTGLAGAQTTGLNIGNQAAASELPVTQARNAITLGALQSYQGAGQPSSYATTINGMEGNGQDPRSSAIGGFVDGTWQQFAQENPQYFRGMSPDQMMQARANPGLRGAATDWLARKNATGLANAGVQPSGAALGLAHFLGVPAAAAMAKADPSARATDVLTQAIGPDLTRKYVQANPDLAVTTAGGLQNKYSKVPSPFTQPVQASATPQLGATPQAPAQGGQPASDVGQQTATYNQQADAMEQRARVMDTVQAEAANFKIPVNVVAQRYGLTQLEDPAMLRQNALNLRKTALELSTSGAIQREKSINSNVDLRPGGMALIQTPNGPQYVKNPQLEPQVNPDGSISYVHIAPALPGSAPGTSGDAEPVVGPDGKPVLKALPPQLTNAREEAYHQFAGKDADSFVAAKNTQGLLTQMNDAAAELNHAGGFLGTGPLAPERLGFASKVNDIFRTFGMKDAFDPNAIGAWEELVKATRTAGFELASHYEGHARQAASTIENATSAVPSESNSPLGFVKVSSGINEIAQQTADVHTFKQQVYDQSGDLSKAETEFYTKFPAQMYARRAISNIKPYSVKGPEDFNRYLPGTYIKLPNGEYGMVPERSGAPGIPDYIKQHQMQGAQ